MAVIANWNKITKKNLPKVLTSFPLMDSSPLHVSQMATCPVHFKSKDSTLASRPSAYPRRCPAHYLSMLRANRSDLWIFYYSFLPSCSASCFFAQLANVCGLDKPTSAAASFFVFDSFKARSK